MLKVSVIVPTYNDDVRLQKCITALSEQSLDSDDYEIIIVNNDEDDLTITLPNGNFRILRESRPGSYAARNEGIRHAKSSILAFTDSDCIPCKRWLEVGLSALRDKNVPRVAGEINVFSKNARMTSVECYEAIFAFDQKESVKRGSAVTANLFVRRRVFEEIGLFDSRLLSGGDTEWNGRATRSGFRILYEETATVHHPARHSWRELSKKIERTTGGKFSINPAYTLSVLRSLAPPIEAGRIILNSGEDTRTKLLAFLIAYRIKLKKITYLLQLRTKKVQPQRS